MKNRSVMQHAFSMVPSIKKPRSVFDRSHGYKTTMDSDYLVPIYFKNILPGDSVSLRHSILMRLNSAMVRPVMDNLYVDMFYFYVPYRLIWSNFQKFMGEQASPSDSISYTVPQTTTPNVASGGVALGSLYDYFGIPTEALSGGGATTGLTINNLYPRAYIKIWLDWFKDENLQNSTTLDLGDGPDTYGNYVLQKRGKKHDYFTSCLPNLQKGSTQVSLPLGTSATVKGSSVALLTGAQQAMTLADTVSGAAPTNLRALGSNSATLIDTTTVVVQAGNGLYPTNLYADLATATAAPMASLRASIALQQFLENDARGGTRYVEILRHRWGVVSPDQRLQRSELLGLSSDPIKINPVTATTASATPGLTTGAMAAFGSGVAIGNGFTKSFTEHGVVIGLANVRSDITYAHGLRRDWSYRTRYDFFNPEFAALSEQAVINKEIYANLADGTGAAQKEGTFGYQERYAEERYSPSMVTGLMRPQATGTLAVYNLTENFTSQPTLGATFIQSNTIAPLDRAIQVPSEPQWVIDAYFSERWARVMPTFGIPGLMRL